MEKIIILGIILSIAWVFFYGIYVENRENKLKEIAKKHHKIDWLICLKLEEAIERNDVRTAYQILKEGANPNEILSKSIWGGTDFQAKSMKEKLECQRDLFRSQKKHKINDDIIVYFFLDLSTSKEMDRLLKYFGALPRSQAEKYWLKQGAKRKKEEKANEKIAKQKNDEEKKLKAKQNAEFLDAVLH